MSYYTLYDTYAGHRTAADFSPANGHIAIETTQTSNSASPEFSARNLTDDELMSWFADEVVIETSRLLATVLKVHAGARWREANMSHPYHRTYQICRPWTPNVPIVARSYGSACGKLRLPPPFIDFVASHTTVALDFDVATPSKKNGDEELPSQTKSKGIICVLGPISLGMCHCAATRSLLAVVMGLCDHQASKLTQMLRMTPRVLVSPMLLPIIWLNILGEMRARRVIGRKQALNRTEIELGMHWGVEHVNRRVQSIDFDIATRRLTIYGSEMAWDFHAIDAQNEMLALIEMVHAEIHGPQSDCADHAELKTRARHVKQVLSGLMLWTKSAQHRIQMQLQTMYSLISRHDNDLSYATAVASQQIAELTQRDSAVMTELAAQSKALAARTWRHGVDMRVMAIITLFTLPGTFTATLFNTSFFDFQTSTSGGFVSPWIWLYFAVTATFTAICLSGGYITSRSMSLKAEKAIRLPEQHVVDSHDDGVNPWPQSRSPNQDQGQGVPLYTMWNRGHVGELDLAEHQQRRFTTGASAAHATNVDAQKLLPDDLAPERQYWDDSNILGTQSYGSA